MLLNVQKNILHKSRSEKFKTSEIHDLEKKTNLQVIMYFLHISVGFDVIYHLSRCFCLVKIKIPLIFLQFIKLKLCNLIQKEKMK